MYKALRFKGRPAISVICVVISALTATGFTPLGLIPVHNGKAMSLSKTAVPTAPKVPLNQKTMTKGECI